MRIGALMLYICMLWVGSANAIPEETMISYIQEHNLSISEHSAKSIVSSIYNASNRFGIPPVLILAVIKVESTFDHNQVSSEKAVGLMQIHKPTWIDNSKRRRRLEQHVGRSDVNDPHTNILAGTWIIRQYMDIAEKRGDSNPIKSALTMYLGGKKNNYYRKTKGVMQEILVFAVKREGYK